MIIDAPEVDEYGLTPEEMERDEDERSMFALNKNCHITGDYWFPKPHSGQLPMRQASRHIIAACGRRFGKTEYCVSKILRDMNYHKGLYLWYGESWDNDGMLRAERLFISRMRYVYRAEYGRWDIPEGAFYKRKRRELTHPNGSVMRFKTAKHPEAGRGDGLRGVVLDECAHYGEQIFSEIVRPALMRSQGYCYMMSTPKGLNWYYNHWLRVKDNPEWLNFHARTEDNPFIPREEIEAAERETLPEVFRQEYLAEFVDTGWGAFAGIDNVLDPTIMLPGKPQEGREYVFGIDFAKVRDFTVVAVWDLEAKALVHYDRFNKMSYDLQEERIEQLYRHWRPDRMICDYTGAGIPVVDGLRKRGLPAQRFKFTQASKEKMIEDMAYGIANGLLRLPGNPACKRSMELVSEFRAYTKEKSPSGNLKYGAPEGLHDDIVIACGLGYTMVRRYTSHPIW